MLIAEALERTRDVWEALTTAGQGMRVTWKYLTRPDEIITVQYPREKLEIPPGYRGRLVNDVPRCISCDLCAQACPPGCIHVEWETGEDRKRILTHYTIDMTTCLYCGLCTEACPTECLTMDGGYEYSTAKKEDWNFAYHASEEDLAVQREAARARAEEKARREEEAKRKKEARQGGGGAGDGEGKADS